MVIYSVSQVTAYLKETLEGDPLLADLLVEGEVSGLRVSTAGHTYFALKDRQSVLRCVMFRGQRGADLLTEGAAIAAHGRMTFYERSGSADFSVDLALPQGVGALAMEFERLKQRLEAEGLFELSRKRPLPPFPQVIGVVTSPAGAVFHDIQNVLRRRYPLAELLLAPTAVQGDGAADQVAAALERLNRDGRADVIIVARGGGSLEDLWAFNEEIVARAIYASRIPVVSGVGHETDVTIADLVADLRAPTPSAAAEMVTPDQNALRQHLLELAFRLRRSVAEQIAQRRAAIAEASRSLERGLPDLATWRRQVDDNGRVIQRQMERQVSLARRDVAHLAQQLRALDPHAILRRGYAIVEKPPAGAVVSSVSQVSAGDELNIILGDGSLSATAGNSARPRPTNGRRKTSPPALPELMNRLI